MACYYGGDEEIYDFDVAAMDCIINLHYTQEDACIDIKGSVCGNNYGGGLMRGQMGWWYVFLFIIFLRTASSRS